MAELGGKSINGRLSILYSEWRKGHPGEDLIACGVVDEKDYASSNPRIVFLNKEANATKNLRKGQPMVGRDGLLPFLVKRGSTGKNFYRSNKQPGLWAYGIINDFPSIDLIEEADLNCRAASGLKSVGWTNLKKSGGQGISSKKTIRDAASAELAMWAEELEIMSPDMILCGGVFDIAWPLLSCGRPHGTLAVAGHEYSCGLWSSGKSDCLVFGFQHPAARGPYANWYSLLQRVFQKLKGQGLCPWMPHA